MKEEKEENWQSKATWKEKSEKKSEKGSNTKYLKWKRRWIKIRKVK